MRSKQNTSWGEEADWYDEMVEADDSYQSKVILPNLLRMMNIKKGETVLDIACGQGFFSRAFEAAGAKVIGTDIGEELILRAREKSSSVSYHVGSADALPFVKTGTIDKAVIVLALQNIENLKGALAEASRALNSHGELSIVLNHPAFRIPKASSWEFDEKESVLFRRLDSYMSDSRVGIEMHPGADTKSETISFHRPLQTYFKMLGKHGFAVTRLEEWISHKESQAGPRQSSENRARKEFPLFLALQVMKTK